jgi:hypothetical protein
MEAITQNVLQFIDIFKLVYKEAFVVFLLVGFAKLLGVVSRDKMAQYSNILVSFLLSGASMPKSDLSAQRLFMLMLVSAFYYKVWKLLKENVPKWYKAIKKASAEA